MRLSPRYVTTLSKVSHYLALMLRSLGMLKAYPHRASVAAANAGQW